VEDVKTEGTCFSSLPAPNFELLTRRSLIPLDLKRCQPHSMNTLDGQKQKNTLIAVTQGVGGATSRDVKITSELTNHHTSHFAVQKSEGVAAAMCSSHVTQAQRQRAKVNTPTIHSNHYGCGKSHGNQITSALNNKTGQKSGVFTYSSNQQIQQEQNLRNHTWNELGDDEEFDELCKMVDLSFDDDGVVTEQAAMVTAPDNSQIDSQNGHHAAAGSTKQTWTCPMCNEQFEGRFVIDMYSECHRDKWHANI